MTKEEKISIDDIDRKILQILQKDASLTVKEIAQKVHLSTTPCWKRLQRLENNGVIKAKVAILEPARVGSCNIVYIMVKASDHGKAWGEKFAREISQLEEVLEIYRMSGEVDYFLKAVVSNIVDYDKLLQKIVERVEVRDISSMFAIENIKYSTALPLRNNK